MGKASEQATRPAKCISHGFGLVGVNPLNRTVVYEAGGAKGASGKQAGRGSQGGF